MFVCVNVPVFSHHLFVCLCFSSVCIFVCVTMCVYDINYIIVDTPFFATPLIFSPVRINFSETETIGCRAVGNPEATVRIEDPNSVVLSSSPISHALYTFESVTYDRAGDYKCVAVNIIDSIERIRVLPFQVIIQGIK